MDFTTRLNASLDAPPRRAAAVSFTGGSPRTFFKDATMDLSQSETLLQLLESRLSQARKELLEMYELSQLAADDANDVLSRKETATVADIVARTYATTSPAHISDSLHKGKSMLHDTKGEAIDSKSEQKGPERKIIMSTIATAGVGDEKLRFQTSVTAVLEGLANQIIRDIRNQNPTRSTEIWNQDLQNELDRHRTFAGQMKQQLQDAMDRLKRHDIKMDILRGHLLRKNKLLEEQRSSYYKELVLLREQLFQKKIQGDQYDPVDWGRYFDKKSLEKNAADYADFEDDDDDPYNSDKKKQSAASKGKLGSDSPRIDFQVIQQEEIAKLRNDITSLEQKLLEKERELENSILLGGPTALMSENQIITELVRKLSEQQQEFNSKYTSMQKQIELRERVKWERTLEDKITAQKDLFISQLALVSSDFRNELKEAHEALQVADQKSIDLEAKMKELWETSEERQQVILRLKHDLKEQTHKMEELLFRRARASATPDSNRETSPEALEADLALEQLIKKNAEIRVLEHQVDEHSSTIDRLKFKIDEYESRLKALPATGTQQSQSRSRTAAESQLLDKLRADAEKSQMAYEELYTRFVTICHSKHSLDSRVNELHLERDNLLEKQMDLEHKVNELEDTILSLNATKVTEKAESSPIQPERRRVRGTSFTNSLKSFGGSLSRLPTKLTNNPESPIMSPQAPDTGLSATPRLRSRSFTAGRISRQPSLTNALNQQTSANIEHAASAVPESPRPHAQTRGSMGSLAMLARRASATPFSRSGSQASLDQDLNNSPQLSGSSLGSDLVPTEPSRRRSSSQGSRRSSFISPRLQSIAAESSSTNSEIASTEAKDVLPSDAPVLEDAEKLIDPAVKPNQVIPQLVFEHIPDEGGEASPVEELDGDGFPINGPTSGNSKASPMSPRPKSALRLSARDSRLSLSEAYPKKNSVRDAERNAWAQERLFLHKRVEKLEAELIAARGHADFLQKSISMKPRIIPAAEKKKMSAVELTNIQKAVEQDIKLQEEETVSKWKLLLMGVTSQLKLKKAEEKVPKQIQDEIKVLSVFDRLQMRSRVHQEKLRERMRTIREQRRSNWENVLKSIFLLVQPTLLSSGSTSSVIAFNPEIVSSRQREPRSPYSRPSSSNGFASPRLQTPQDMQGCYEIIRARGVSQSPSSQARFNMRVGNHASFEDYVPILSETESIIPIPTESNVPLDVRAKTPRTAAKTPPPPRAAIPPVTVIPRNLQKGRVSEVELENKLRKNKAFVAPASSARKLGGGFSKQSLTPRKPQELRPNTGSLNMSLDGLEYSIHGHQIYSNSTLSFSTSKSEMDLARAANGASLESKAEDPKELSEQEAFSPREYLPVKDRPPTPFHRHIVASDSIELLPNDDGTIDVIRPVQVV